MKITKEMAQKAADYLRKRGWVGFEETPWNSAAERRTSLEQLRKAIEKAVAK